MSLKPHLSATLILGLPLVATHVARMMIGVTDTVMVGRYGVDPLAALVLATSYFFILMILGSGYALGLMGLIATARARRAETRSTGFRSKCGGITGRWAKLHLPRFTSKASGAWISTKWPTALVTT
mgnify:CR=1 FL=1